MSKAFRTGLLILSLVFAYHCTNEEVLDDEPSELNAPIEGQYLVESRIDVPTFLTAVMEAVVVIVRDIAPDVFGLAEIIDNVEVILLEIPSLLTGDTLPEILERAFGEEASAYGSVIGSFASSALDYTIATHLSIGATDNPQGSLSGSEEFQSISTESSESRYELLSQDLSEAIEEQSFGIRVEGDKLSFEEHMLTIPYGAFLDSVVEQASLAAGIEATDTKSLFPGTYRLRRRWRTTRTCCYHHVYCGQTGLFRLALATDSKI